MKIEVEYKGKKRTFLTDEDTTMFDGYYRIGKHTEIVISTIYGTNGTLVEEETRIERKSIVFNKDYVESIARSEELKGSE
jgi:hypothetical protein